ncbi:MAG: hypothetical protein JNK12_19400 [Acidimicrobiales bacterium]|nr:hypothetical protein [Acidimicrobiales bacterium]
MVRDERPSSVLVVVHAVREDRERRAYALLLDRLRADGHELSVICWDRGKSVLDLEALGPVGDIEDVNRWRLPIWLAKHGLAPVARRLRHARMRWWWHRAHHPASVVVLGLLRPEMAHYLPPGVPVGAVLGWRPPEDPESLATTLTAADTVVARDDATAAACRAEDPDVDVAVFEHLWPRLHWSLHLRLPPLTAPAAVGIPDGRPFVLGLGPLDWDGGADQFVAMAGRVRAALPGAPVHFGWVGGHPEGPSHFPYRFDADRLGVAATFHWLGERDDYHELVRRADVVVLPGHRPLTLPYDPTVGWYLAEDRDLPAAFTPLPEPFAALLDVLEVPVVRFDLPESEALTLGRGTTVTYPDTAALAAAVVDALDRPRPTTLARARSHLLGEVAP